MGSDTMCTTLEREKMVVRATWKSHIGLARPQVEWKNYNWTAVANSKYDQLAVYTKKEIFIYFNL